MHDGLFESLKKRRGTKHKFAFKSWLEKEVKCTLPTELVFVESNPQHGQGEYAYFLPHFFTLW